MGYEYQFLGIPGFSTVSTNPCSRRLRASAPLPGAAELQPDAGKTVLEGEEQPC